MRDSVMTQSRLLAVLFAVLTFGSVVTPVWAQASGDAADLQVMKGFTELEEETRKQQEIEEKSKHQILFIMGVALLLLLLATAYFGISLGFFGKNVFVPHMICAGLSVTLAIAHSIVAIVWFYPF
jgi:hypothetical protein